MFDVSLSLDSVTIHDIKIIKMMVIKNSDTKMKIEGWMKL